MNSTSAYKPTTLQSADGGAEFAMQMTNLGFGKARLGTSAYGSEVFTWERSYGERDHKVANRVMVVFNGGDNEVKIYLTAQNGLGYGEAKLGGLTPVAVAVATISAYMTEAQAAARYQG